MKMLNKISCVEHEFDEKNAVIKEGVEFQVLHPENEVEEGVLANQIKLEMFRELQFQLSVTKGKENDRWNVVLEKVAESEVKYTKDGIFVLSIRGEKPRHICIEAVKNREIEYLKDKYIFQVVWLDGGIKVYEIFILLDDIQYK